MIRLFSLVVIVILVASGCSIPHRTAQDYEQYLINNNGKSRLATTDLETDYLLTRETIEHQYEFRSATVGYAHVWIVEFGDMLETTLQSEDVQNAFRRLSRRTNNESLTGNLITFHLVGYEFSDFGAHIVLEIGVSQDGEEIFRRTYDEDGRTQGGKMFWGGPFAMKNSIQQSTKLAVDQVITDFINDFNDRKPDYDRSP